MPSIWLYQKRKDVNWIWVGAIVGCGGLFPHHLVTVILSSSTMPRDTDTWQLTLLAQALPIQGALEVLSVSCLPSNIHIAGYIHVHVCLTWWSMDQSVLTNPPPNAIYCKNKLLEQDFMIQDSDEYLQGAWIHASRKCSKPVQRCPCHDRFPIRYVSQRKHVFILHIMIY